MSATTSKVRGTQIKLDYSLLCDAPLVKGKSQVLEICLDKLGRTFLR